MEATTTPPDHRFLSPWPVAIYVQLEDDTWECRALELRHPSQLLKVVFCREVMELLAPAVAAGVVKRIVKLIREDQIK